MDVGGVVVVVVVIVVVVVVIIIMLLPIYPAPARRTCPEQVFHLRRKAFRGAKPRVVAGPKLGKASWFQAKTSHTCLARTPCCQ